MSVNSFTESTVEAATLEWLDDLGWATAYGPEIGPDSPLSERTQYDETILQQRLHDALTRINPALPQSALDDAFRKLTRPEGSSLEMRNRAFHRMLVNGVTVEYRQGADIRGAQVKVIDYETPE